MTSPGRDHAVTTRPLRVLVLTNHFAEYGGSEIVALEVAEWFARQGDTVTIGTNHAGAPMTRCAAAFEIVTAVEGLDLSSFDLVWCQHDLLSLFPLASFRHAARHRPPHVAVAALSPTQPFEQINTVLAEALSADVFANSTKTADAIAAASHGLIPRRDIVVFRNAAPVEFWTAPRPAATTLSSITLISNHPPHELVTALQLLRGRGVSVRWIGVGGERVRVGPDEIDADAIITIGKSVIYALAARRPVYLYDKFGGDGWLTPANWSSNLFHNFAGHPAKRRITAAEIADEVVDGFADAARVTPAVVDALGPEFHLEHHLAALRRRASGSSARRTTRLRRRLSSPTFLAHLEISNSRSLLTRRFFIGFSGSRPPHSVRPARWWTP